MAANTISVLWKLLGVFMRCQKQKMNAKSLSVWLEQLVNCFLKALEENCYIWHLEG